MIYCLNRDTLRVKGPAIVNDPKMTCENQEVLGRSGHDPHSYYLKDGERHREDAPCEL